MKKIISIALFIAIVLSLGMTAFAATPQDLIYSKDATLKASFIKYGDITVKSGVTLTIDKNSGFEIAGSITVEPGGKIVCNGTSKGQFNFAMINKNAKISGLDIYYRYKTENGIEVLLADGGYDAVASMDLWDWSGGWTPSFKWDESVQGWCLTEETNINLSETVYHSGRDMDCATQLADRLKMLGLFKGTDKGYDLAREGSRVEALVMLIRLLGKEDEALSGTWTHPFTDVPAWADKYMDYAYETGLTHGIDATKYGTGATSAQIYFTFVLRTLGKTDTEDYKVYDHAFELIEKTGILSTENDVYEICLKKFWRSDMVVVSYRTLSAQTVSGGTLGDKLIAGGVLTEEELKNALR